MDEVDGGNKFMDDKEEDDETYEELSRAFSPQKDQTIEDEIQQATQTQGLSPRRLQHSKFQLKIKKSPLSLKADQTLGYFHEEHPND